jgi:hypothetical protein
VNPLNKVNEKDLTTYVGINVKRYSKNEKHQYLQLTTENGLFCSKSMNILLKSVGKIRWQFSLASLFCQCQRVYLIISLAYPLAGLISLASLLANDFMDLGQKTPHWQGYILKYIWSESLKLTPIYFEEKNARFAL